MHRISITLLHLFLIILIVSIGCNKDGNNNPVTTPNQPPNEPFAPTPTDGARNQQIIVGLEWRCIDLDEDTLTYDVYFGTTENPPILTENNLTNTAALTELEYGTTYYWKIVAKDGHDHATIGPVWRFTTTAIVNSPPAEPNTPTPSNQAEDQPLVVQLRWRCSDPDGDSLRYDLFFGSTEQPLEQLLTNSRERSYTTDSLDYSTTYSWRIIVTDTHDHSVASPTWTFTTITAPEIRPRPGEIREFQLGDGSYGPIIMVWIPPGSFMMGALASEGDAQVNEFPRHQVHIPKGFWMSKYETSQLQWQKVMNSNPSFFRADNLPVETVSWLDVHDFIDRVNVGIDSGLFRLPSEAEWEYACRSGNDSTDFFYGSDLTYVQLNRYAWHSENSDSTTHPVGSKNQNFWGLHDMHGNVWEWCEDWYHYDYNGAPVDGSPWLIPEGTTRIRRGGAWNYPKSNCRTAYRFRSSPDSRFNSIGFRLVKEELDQ